MQSNEPIVGLVSVNVAEPEIIGTHRGKPVSSAIKKRRAEAAADHDRAATRRLP